MRLERQRVSPHAAWAVPDPFTRRGWAAEGLVRLRATLLRRRLLCSGCRQVIDPALEMRADDGRFCGVRCAELAWQAAQT